ncbi:CMGC protein kinase [Chaetomidium leptoderma]|uniref:CMGC protein kinase n=1 Tax=Chaetomidium leptoderma TaxID=669021 RepID=A0AAN6VIJ8_9PEZI|nr:CMGC protein kinase [Chaetomidium leptoderma]
MAPTKEPSEPLALGTRLVGLSGRQYQITKMLQQRTDPVLSCVYLATTQEHEKYVAKNVFHTEFEYQLDLQRPLADCPNLRTVVDTVPHHLLFLYRYLADDLLKLAKNESLSDATRKWILREALAGLADLHDQNIFHSDIKPNNIFVDYDETPNGVIDVKAVQIGDLEMGCAIPPDLNVRGARLGNPMWRSPEAHAAGRMNLPSDIFSFGLVCIYTMLRRIVIRLVDDKGAELSEAEQERIIVKRLLSHFGDGPGLVGLLDHLDDESAQWRDLVLAVMEEFTSDSPRKPFSMWDDVDESFRDVVTKMTSLDPKGRITAREALDHRWFRSA